MCRILREREKIILFLGIFVGCLMIFYNYIISWLIDGCDWYGYSFFF